MADASSHDHLMNTVVSAIETLPDAFFVGEGDNKGVWGPALAVFNTYITSLAQTAESLGLNPHVYMLLSYEGLAKVVNDGKDAGVAYVKSFV